MKVLILGYGNVGSILAELLSREPSVKSIVCGDLNPKERGKNNKIVLRKINLVNKKEVSEIISQVKPNVVVNAALPIFNTLIMDCCIQSKVNYLDSASYWDEDESPNPISPYKVEQLEYNEDFQYSQITGLINAGVSPGLTNILARQSIKGLDEVDHIKIRLLEETKMNKLVFSWCKEWLIDEIESIPLVYSGNKFQLIDSLNNNVEIYDFPEFGKRRVSHIAQEEVGTLPLYLKVKNVDIKAYDDQADLIKKSLSLNISPTEEKADIKNFGEAQFGIVVEAYGKENGRNKIIKSFVYKNKKL